MQTDCENHKSKQRLCLDPLPTASLVLPHHVPALPPPLSSFPFCLSASFLLMKTLTKWEWGGKAGVTSQPVTHTYLQPPHTTATASHPSVFIPYRSQPIKGSESCGIVGSVSLSIQLSSKSREHASKGLLRAQRQDVERLCESQGLAQANVWCPQLLPIAIAWGWRSSCPPLGSGEVRMVQEQTGQCPERCKWQQERNVRCTGQRWEAEAQRAATQPVRGGSGRGQRPGRLDQSIPAPKQDARPWLLQTSLPRSFISP